MTYFFFCSKCEGDAGTKHELCLECDSEAGVPRFGRKTLKLSRAAYEEHVAKIAREKGMNSRVPIDEAIEIALAPRKRRLAAQGKAKAEAEAEAISPQERRKIAELRRAEKLLSRKHEEMAKREKLLRPPPPHSYLYGVSPEGAEHLVGDWMRHLGAENVRVTDFTSDGGIDVDSEKYVAQVKLYSTITVGRPEIQQLVGAAVVNGKRPLFFTSSTFTAEAKRYAAQAEVALFRFVPEEGTLIGVNPLGQKMREIGLATVPPFP
jgi:restriction endonuclease Mrr